MPLPYIVAGPCSVESRSQLEETAVALSRMPQVQMVRCGVWKPRTRPGQFEGLGETALQWISEIRTSGCMVRPLPFACEVARPEHVEVALRYGIDAVWVGARTTANPFMVQELAEALRGTGMPVLVKNAPSPDVQLWMGAIDRLRRVGLTEVTAVHRGYDLFRNDGYRNNPLWEMPIELRRAMPDVPLLCDPSHIAGRRGPIAALAQTAMNLGFDGLMVEVHPHPDEAYTDAAQQITPATLQHLLDHLELRRTDAGIMGEELAQLRGQIDHIDRQVLQLLAARMEVSAQIAQLKRQGNMAVFQPKRWDALLQDRLEQAREMGLDEEFVKELFEKVHAESVRIQQELVEG